MANGVTPYLVEPIRPSDLELVAKLESGAPLSDGEVDELNDLYSRMTSMILMREEPDV